VDRDGILVDWAAGSGRSDTIGRTSVPRLVRLLRQRSVSPAKGCYRTCETGRVTGVG